MPQTPINRLNNLISYLKVFALSVWVRISIMFDLLYGQFKSIKGLWSKQGYLCVFQQTVVQEAQVQDLKPVSRIVVDDTADHGMTTRRMTAACVTSPVRQCRAAQYVHSHASPFPVEESEAQAFDLLKRVLNLVESINRAGLTSPWTLAGVRLWWEHIHQRVWAEEGQVREANGLAAPEPRSLPR